MKCVKCKKTIDEGDTYCGYCGIHQEKYKKYLEKVENKVHKEKDKEYNNKIKTVQNKLNDLEKKKIEEIQSITNSRWTDFGSNNFLYNMTEGKISINGTEHKFSDIKGAEIVKDEAYRIITSEKGKAKKHASLGGAVAGGLILGPVGAVVGGSALGKTKMSGKSISDSIPTCNHIGVKVDINGFTSEIVLLHKTVDQTSSLYTSNLNIAQKIVDKLGVLAQTPVPRTFIKPQEEKSVKEIEKQIEVAEKELREAIDDKPTYDIPDNYLK